MALLGCLVVVLGDDRFELGNPVVLRRLGCLGATALLEIERVAAVFEDGSLPAIEAIDLTRLGAARVIQVHDGRSCDEVTLDEGELLGAGQLLALLGHGMESSRRKGEANPCPRRFRIRRERDISTSSVDAIVVT